MTKLWVYSTLLGVRLRLRLEPAQASVLIDLRLYLSSLAHLDLIRSLSSWYRIHNNTMMVRRSLRSLETWQTLQARNLYKSKLTTSPAHMISSRLTERCR